jgi:hypothetical protein
MRTHSLCDIVDDDCAVGIPIVHRRQGLVSLLTCGVPYLEFDGGLIIEGDGLCEEGGADCGFSVVVELVLKETYQLRSGQYIWKPWTYLYESENE